MQQLFVYCFKQLLNWTLLFLFNVQYIYLFKKTWFLASVCVTLKCNASYKWKQQQQYSSWNFIDVGVRSLLCVNVCVKSSFHRNYSEYLNIIIILIWTKQKINHIRIRCCWFLFYYINSMMARASIWYQKKNIVNGNFRLVFF